MGVAMYRGFSSLTREDFTRGTCTVNHPLPARALCVDSKGSRYCPSCIAELPGSRRRSSEVCLQGHDLTLPNGLTLSRVCRLCKNEREAAAKRMKRVHALGLEIRADECSVALPTRTKRYELGGAMPSDELCTGARCGPDTAYLFDKVLDDAHESAAARADRKAAAQMLCNSCPVWQLCKKWYSNETELTGVEAAL